MQHIKKIVQPKVITISSGSPANQGQTMTSVQNQSKSLVQSHDQPSQQQATSSKSQHTEEEIRRIDTLFLRFAAIYGHLWRSVYKNETQLELSKKIWLENLKKFETKIIKEVLQRCCEAYSYPPSLPQFFECCRELRDKNRGFFIPQEVQKAKPEVAAKYMRQIKTILNIK